ncbi:MULTISPECIES: hypothetical protein [unclassified Nocardia]|uniref:hypothetical protein n=1 Tax=unclassified Nocardia TaxID=2637762 RepID=UPI00278BC3D6|nr:MULTISPECIES: hypothetical protein [unclassified Nocardia]
MARYTLTAAGVLFLLYPVLRPWHDETTTEGAAAAMGSTLWVVSHVCAMIGFVLVSLGLLGIRDRIGIGPVAAMWVGTGLTLPYYGAEDFGLYAMATEGDRDDLLAVADALRFAPIPAAMFGIGLITVAAASVWVAGALRDSAARYAAMVFAAGFVLFMPQFFGPPAVRIAHGVLVLAGCVWLGFTAAEASRRTARR